MLKLPLAAGLTAALIAAALAAETPAPGAGARRVRYGFLVRNTSGDLVRGASLWTYAPHTDGTAPSSGALRCSIVPEESRDPMGNRVLCFRLPDIPPLGAKVIDIEAELACTDPPAPDDPGPFLDLRAPYSAPAAGAALPNFAARPLAERAAAIHEWVGGYLRPGGRDPRVHDAGEVLHRGRGDCTDFAVLFAALCRREGIPARTLCGFVCPRGGVLRPSALHNWAEYFQDGRWVLADPLRKVRDGEVDAYVVFQVMGDGGTVMPGQPLFRCEGQGLVATMKDE